jgi:hypothetical protein
MQGDLISKSELIEDLRKYAKECEEDMCSPNFWSAIRMVKEKPTAYSVEDVVEKTHEIIYNILEKVLEPLPDGSEYTEEAYMLLYLNTRISDAIRNGGKE